MHDTAPHSARRLSVLVAVAVLALALVGSTGTATASSHAPTVESAVEYGGTVEVVLDRPAESVAVDEVVLDGVAGRVDVRSASVDGSDSRRVVVELDRDVDQIRNLTLSLSVTADGEAADVAATDAETTGAVVRAFAGDDPVEVFRGQRVAVVAPDGRTDVRFDFVGGSRSVTLGTGANSSVSVYESDGLDGRYRIAVGDRTAANLTVEPLDLRVEPTQDAFTDSELVEVDVSSSAGPDRYTVRFSKEGVPVDETAVTPGADGGPIGFRPVCGGNHTVTAVHNDTGASASATVPVRIAGDLEGRFDRSDLESTETVGDVVAIPIESPTFPRENLTVSGAGARLLVDLEDGNGDGRVTALLNTYVRASNPSGRALTARHPDDRVTVLERYETYPSGRRIDDVDAASNASLHLEVTRAPPWGYREVCTPQTVDLADIDLRSRSTPSLRAWRAPAGANVSSMNASELRAARDGASLPGDEAPASDALVLELNASGLEGLIAHRDGNASRALLEGLGDAATFEVRREGPKLVEEPDAVDLASGRARVVPDAARDAYYVIATPSRVDGFRPGQYRAVFEVPAGSPLAANGSETASASFRIDRAAALLDRGGDGSIVLRPERNWSLADRTTLAPGTELAVVVRERDGTVLARNRSVTVDGRERFAATLDLSDVPSGTPVRVLVRPRGGEPIANASGVVRAAAATAGTADGDGDAGTGTATGANGTATADGVDPGHQSGTDDGGTSATGPGFGPATALVAALLALVAGRRFGLRDDP